MSRIISERPNDWVGNTRSFIFAWGLPILAIFAGAIADASLRTVTWTAALIWMGLACLLNARRCGRTHCRYTGPYYLLLTIPVALHGTQTLPLGGYGWWGLGVAILIGGKVIWWASERAWGKYSV